MVEGSRIDDAAHRNDPAAHLGDVLAYDRAVAAALAWAARDGNTLVVSTADHETGGLTLGRADVNLWDPAPLLRATASFEVMSARIRAGNDPAEIIRQALFAVLGPARRPVLAARRRSALRWRPSSAADPTARARRRNGRPGRR